MAVKDFELEALERLASEGKSSSYSDTIALIAIAERLGYIANALESIEARFKGG